MELILTIADRLNLLRTFPDGLNIVDLMCKKNLSKQLEFSSEEMDDIDLVSTNEETRWNPEKNHITKTITLSQTEKAFLKKYLDIVSEKGIPRVLEDLCVKIYEFVEKDNLVI